jgi:uncharacterized membrane protein YqaE (UPF0057 family)
MKATYLMKTLRNKMVALCILLVLSGGYTFGISPGSGVTGNDRDKTEGNRTEQSLATEAELAAVETPSMDESALAEMVSDEADVRDNKSVKQARRRKAAARKVEQAQEAETAVDTEISLQEELMRDEEAQEAVTAQVRGAAGQILLLATTLDRDEFPVSDATVALLLILIMGIPPMAVLATTRRAGTEFWFNLLLTCFLWVPGLVHAAYLVQRTSHS